MLCGVHGFIFGRSSTHVRVFMVNPRCMGSVVLTRAVNTTPEYI